jgi:alkanesulfonate monooxygenase SsuD/methylene tetrahydromethanopterin reductase-like flavin-dependent oxidoreductase (luciferase family)
VYAGEAAIAGHWDTYSAAAHSAGFSPDRSVLRVVRDIIVADTDAEARDLAVNGGVGDAWGNYLMPVYKQFGLLEAMLPGMDMADVDIDTLVEKVWIVGSPDTVAEKLNGVLERTGGWGTTLVYSHDYSDKPDAWNYSLQLLTKEVAPKLDSF